MPLQIEFVSTREAAEIIGVTVGRVHQLRVANDLPAQQIDGRTWIYPRAAVERLAQRKRPAGRPRGGSSKKNSPDF